MSLDRRDFSKQTTEAQHGVQPGFFPIIIDASKYANGQEIEININPVDHIWMPTFFDPSLGMNPYQAAPVPPSGAPSFDRTVVSSGPNQTRQPGGVTPGVGMNFFDEWDNDDAGYFQAGTIFSLRFNSPNAPWLLWGLGTLQSTDFSVEGSGGKYLIGSGDCMRSVTGPISRLWFKKLYPAIVDYDVTPQADRIVLLSSLGYSQLTIGTAAGPFDAGAPGPQPQMSGYATSGGGYITTQLNSRDEVELEFIRRERR